MRIPVDEKRTSRLPGRRRRTAAGFLVTAVAALVLTGCGANGPGRAVTIFGHQPSPKITAADGLCPSVAHLDRLVLTRRGGFAANRGRSPLPPQATVTDPARVRAAARALCALPTMPAGIYNCPADSGISYNLVFWAGTVRFRAVDIDASGCQTVTGLGRRVRWAARSTSFWRILRTTTAGAHPKPPSSPATAHPAPERAAPERAQT
jgi:hypothetical protein